MTLTWIAIIVGAFFGIVMAVDKVYERGRQIQEQLEEKKSKTTRTERAAPLRTRVLSSEDLKEMDEFFKS